jgi:hypothetical protein
MSDLYERPPACPVPVRNLIFITNIRENNNNNNNNNKKGFI